MILNETDLLFDGCMHLRRLRRWPIVRGMVGCVRWMWVLGNVELATGSTASIAAMVWAVMVRSMSGWEAWGVNGVVRVGGRFGLIGKAEGGGVGWWMERCACNGDAGGAVVIISSHRVRNVFWCRSAYTMQAGQGWGVLMVSDGRFHAPHTLWVHYNIKIQHNKTWNNIVNYETPLQHYQII